MSIAWSCINSLSCRSLLLEQSAPVLYIISHVWAAQVKEMLLSNHLWKKLNEVPPSAMIRAANHGKEDTHKQREELTDKISKLRRAHTEMLQPDTDMQNEELDQWHDAPMLEASCRCDAFCAWYN